MKQGLWFDRVDRWRFDLVIQVALLLDHALVDDPGTAGIGLPGSLECSHRRCAKDSTGKFQSIRSAHTPARSDMSDRSGSYPRSRTMRGQKHAPVHSNPGVDLTSSFAPGHSPDTNPKDCRSLPRYPVRLERQQYWLGGDQS